MSTVDDVIANAQMEIGKPYVWGDEGPNTFDCSGLMQWIFGKVGITLPRTAAQQQAYLTKVASPQPGDLVFWGNPAYHVALYIGGGKIIAAPKPGSRVEVENLWGQPAGYGRAKGVSTVFTPVVGAVTGVAKGAADTVTGWLGGARSIALEGAFVLAGVALLGLGVYRFARPQIGTLIDAGKQAL